MFPDFGSQFFHSFVFQVMQQGLVFTSLAKIEKRGGLLYWDPSVKQLGNWIFRLEVEIGTWNVVQAM